ncbi:MAG: type IV pilus twitching motility protein PilT [Candidatus Merdivicinus sp.]|jgi:twitching motility protein PilT
MTEIQQALELAIERKASDIFIVSGFPMAFKINDVIDPIDSERLMPDATEKLITQIYELEGSRSMETLRQNGDDDFSFSIKGLGRFRCNVYKQRNSFAAVLRAVYFNLPDYRTLHIPETVVELSARKKGLILITGSAGSGKSTTLACIIDRINHTRRSHIITIEDPIEFLHSHNQSIVSQREVSHDTQGYAEALRAALRQSPDVILLGEMRDFQTIQTALTAAETGQLVLSTLHTIGAGKTIDRVIDVFPGEQQQQVRIQLSMVLEAVVSQQLIPSVNGGLVPAFEIMLVNSAIRNLIREGKTHQIDNVLFAGTAEGMRTMDGDILRLYKAGMISRENALLYSVNPELLAKKL